MPQAERLAPSKDTATAKLREKASPLGLDLQGGMHLVLEVDASKLPPEEAKGAVDRAIEVIRNRIDQFGVAEPIIQREGTNRIVVQLPGLSDRERARQLIGQTALLVFKLVRTTDEGAAVWNRLDAVLASRARAGQVQVDSAVASRPLTSYFMDQYNAGAFIASTDLPKVEAMLAHSVIDTIVPGDSQILWSADEARAGRTGRWLYVVKKEPEMTGGGISSAQMSNQLDQTTPGARASRSFSGKGRRTRARHLGERRPPARGRARRGRALAPSIRSASRTQRLDHRLVRLQEREGPEIMLKAGALPAPVKIVEERSVGPRSAGLDRRRLQGRVDRHGARGRVHGDLLPGLGLIAVAALGLNFLLLFAGMAGLRSTLTMPGIAGIVLTVGMAVDTNVLIFERIREEMRHGKSIRASIELGYKNAFRTILDAHVTTLLSALFLFQFGTGPIKGFAVTLALGLIANLFTAVFFTRLIYDIITHRRTLNRLSI